MMENATIIANKLGSHGTDRDHTRITTGTGQ